MEMEHRKGVVGFVFNELGLPALTQALRHPPLSIAHGGVLADQDWLRTGHDRPLHSQSTGLEEVDRDQGEETTLNAFLDRDPTTQCPGQGILELRLDRLFRRACRPCGGLEPLEG